MGIRIVESNFLTSAVNPKDYPSSEFADVAFVGRSNVGKSSLLNSILGRKSIAKTSGKPGKTRLVNFFLVRFKHTENDELEGFINFVDLPGYGYAKVSKGERESWKKMMRSYFSERVQLRGVILLVDIRHKADEKDIMMAQMLEEFNIRYLVAATKSDKVPVTKAGSYLDVLSKQFGIDRKSFTAVSSLKKKGVDQIIGWIEKLVL